MPAAAIPIISLIVGAAGTGTGIYEAATKPGVPKPKPTAPVSNVVQPTNRNAEIASLGTTPQDILEQAGGVSPQYLIENAPLFSGVGNQPGISSATQQVVNGLFGGGGGTASPGPSTASNFQPAGVSANPGSGFVSSGLSDLFAQQFGVS